jgi:hypothetical protein
VEFETTDWIRAWGGKPNQELKELITPSTSYKHDSKRL